ncbi:MAG: ExbD/TolR family protein, partial [Rhodosalinus sp.]
MRLTRRARPLAGPSLVSMIDVLMIMLIFFMVTSTFLNLRMMP